MNAIRQATTRLPSSAFWLCFFFYALAICTVFTRTGVDISIGMLLVVATYRGVRNPPRERVPWLVLLPFLAWFGVAVLSTLVNKHFLGNLEALLHYYRFALPFAMIPALYEVNLRRWLLVLLAAFSLITLYGVAQYFTGINWLRLHLELLPQLETVHEGAMVVYRAKGAFRNPIVYSSMMLMIAPFFFSLFLSDTGRERYLWLGGTAMGMLAVALSVTRSAGIGLFVGMLVLVLRLRPRYSVPIITTALAGFTLLAVLTATGIMKEHFGGPHTPPVISRLVNTTLDTGLERLYRWEAGWLAIKKRPWLGVGPDGDLKRRMVRYMKKVSRRHGHYRYRLIPSGLIHNVHIQVAFQLGLLGFLAEMAMWGSVFVWNARWLRRAGEGFALERAIMWGANGALAGSFVDGMFNNNLLDAPNTAVIMIFVGLSLYAGIRIREGLREASAESPAPATS